jgi:hypothetical protein
MGTLRCDSCGEEFIVLQDSSFADKKAADRQAQWLEMVLAEEHERERKHPDRILLPDFPAEGVLSEMPWLRQLGIAITVSAGQSRCISWSRGVEHEN